MTITSESFFSPRKIQTVPCRPCLVWQSSRAMCNIQSKVAVGSAAFGLPAVLILYILVGVGKRGEY